MNCLIFKFMLFLSLCFGFGYTKDLPSYLPICHQNHPMLSECVRNATNDIRPYLLKGIPELGIAEIEPLVLPMIKLEQGTKMVHYKAMLKNITIDGLSSYNFTNLYVQTDMFAINGEVKFDLIKVTADYFITGRIFKTPIHGMGSVASEFNETTCRFTLRGQIVHKSGTEYYSNSDTSVDCFVKGTEIVFDRLFDGDETLSQKTNNFIKENSDDLAKEVKPAINSVINMYVDDMIQKISASIPFNKLFPKMT